jgi:hypothetical protein
MSWLWVLAELEIWFTAKAISGLVDNVKYMKDPVASLKGTLTFFQSSPLCLRMFQGLPKE